MQKQYICRMCFRSASGYTEDVVQCLAREQLEMRLFRVYEHVLAAEPDAGFRHVPMKDIWKETSSYTKTPTFLN